MIAPKGAQKQEGGDESTNYQAGNDIHVYGLTIDQARDVALDVFRSNALELRGIAQAVAQARAETITNEFFEKLGSEFPDRASTLADPDVQSVLFEAQKEFARSGEEDLKSALIELLSARTGESDRNLRTLALNEAISSAPKLTEGQRRAIAWIFYLRYTRSTGSMNAQSYFAQVAKTVQGIGVDLPRGYAHYQHIEYVGAGSMSISSVAFGKGLMSGVEGFFTQGFEESSVDPGLMQRLRGQGLVVPAMRNADRLQINLIAEEELSQRLTAAGMLDDLNSINPLMNIGRMSEEEVAEEAEAAIPEISTLRKIWDEPNSALASMTLTSVGLAIGHAYWSKLTGNTAPLSIWLP